jgi:hypothetical protein
MKLPDFLKSASLNALKTRMGISVDTYGSFDLAVEEGRLTLEELGKLSSGEGIDVSFEQLTILPDGTLAYKDSRVLLYIRDVHVYGGRNYEPRYHLSNCTKLEEMNAGGRFGRFVIAAETSGEFKLNIINNRVSRTERRRLRVCQKCLAGLKFNGFNFGMSSSSRNAFVRDFIPGWFFQKYPRSLHKKKPAFSSVTAPLNNYTPNFAEVSTRLRQQRGWKCEGVCGRIFARDRLRRFLDVHHADGDRSNNHPDNLKVLCIGCHAKQHFHGHLKSSGRYKDYLREVGHA